MQLDTQKHEVSQYLRYAHANRHAEARVSRCMNTRHAEGKVDVEVSYGMARRHATGHVDAHMSPRMRDDTHAIGWHVLIGRQLLYIPSHPSPFLLFSFHRNQSKTWLERDREKEVSPDQSIQDIDVGFWDLASRYQDEDLEGRKRVWSTSGIKESSHIA
ncbi:hypothetical protein F2Q69_00006289 [Brassica cretica]|uniref:Uncharacterized protein n=1 Tax=Brassica cretica TaxID=69181 RepID=A0A8S9NV97_BRACR|nr:hypothetical protein F2Q69_00006289 [Brassica cretica]